MFADIIETNPYQFMASAPFRKIVKNILQFFPSVNLFLIHLCEKASLQSTENGLKAINVIDLYRSLRLSESLADSRDAAERCGKWPLL